MSNDEPTQAQIEKAEKAAIASGMTKVAPGVYPATVSGGHMNVGTLRDILKGVDAQTMIGFDLNNAGRTIATLSNPSNDKAVKFPVDEA